MAAAIYQIASAQTSSPLSWNENPGAFERHLQRRHKNVLFPPNRRTVTQGDINTARLRDHQDYEELKARAIRFTEDILKLPDHIASSQVNALRERMDELIRDAMGVGGRAYEIALEVKKIRQTLIQSWRGAVAGNAEALRALDEADQFWHANAPLFHIPFIREMLRKDGPIPAEDVVPALLSEQPETIATVMSWFKDPRKKAIVQAEAASILKSVMNSGATIDRLDEKVQALGLGRK
jgi:hypothetical protein